MEQSNPPLLHCKHDSPAWNRDGFLSCDGLPDLVEFALYPLICGVLLAMSSELTDRTKITYHSFHCSEASSKPLGPRPLCPWQSSDVGFQGRKTGRRIGSANNLDKSLEQSKDSNLRYMVQLGKLGGIAIGTPIDLCDELHIPPMSSYNLISLSPCHKLETITYTMKPTPIICWAMPTIKPRIFGCAHSDW